MADSPPGDMNPPKRLRTTGSEEETPSGGHVRERSAVDVVGDRLTLPYSANSDVLIEIIQQNGQLFGCGKCKLRLLENTGVLLMLAVYQINFVPQI